MRRERARGDRRRRDRVRRGARRSTRPSSRARSSTHGGAIARALWLSSEASTSRPGPARAGAGGRRAADARHVLRPSRARPTSPRRQPASPTDCSTRTRRSAAPASAPPFHGRDELLDGWQTLRGPPSFTAGRRRHRAARRRLHDRGPHRGHPERRLVPLQPHPRRRRPHPPVLGVVLRPARRAKLDPQAGTRSRTCRDSRLAMAMRWTSSGPSTMCRMRAMPKSSASRKSCETPPPPCAWIARSTT